MSKNLFDFVNQLSGVYKETLDSENPNGAGNDIVAAAETFNAIKDMLPPQEQGLNVGDHCLFYEIGEIVECLILDRQISPLEDGGFSIGYKLRVTKAGDICLFEVGQELEPRRKLGENDRMLNMILWSIMPIPK